MVQFESLVFESLIDSICWHYIYFIRLAAVHTYACYLCECYIHYCARSLWLYAKSEHELVFLFSTTREVGEC